jgi:hypothetical protein
MRMLSLRSPVVAALFALCVTRSGASAQEAPGGKEGSLAIPSAIQTEHQQLRDDLARALAERGAVGDAARAIERALTPHLKHDEEVVLLPLGALRRLVDGVPISDTARLLAVVAQIERELPQLLQEHRALLDGARLLKDAAGRERKPEYQGLAGRLWVHVVMEDQVLYQTSILVGRHLQLKQGARTGAPRGDRR